MLRKDIKLILREPRFLLLTVILLATGTVAFLFGRANSASPKISLGVADNDASEYSRLLLDYFEDNKVFSSYIDVVEGNEKELEVAFFNGKLDMYLVIPKDFAENLIHINNVAMKAVINSSDITKAVIYKNLLESYSKYITAVEVNCQSLYDIMREAGYSSDSVNSENTAVSLDLIFTALGKDSFFEREYIERFEGISLVNYYIYSLIMLIVLYIGAFAGLGALKERLSKVELRLATIGRSRILPKISKAAAYTLICGGALTLLLIAVDRLTQVKIGASSIVLVLVSVFVSCLFFVFFGNMFSGTGGYIITANMLILLLTVLGGGIIPIMYLPEILAGIARFTPNYWFIRMLL